MKRIIRITLATVFAAAAILVFFIKPPGLEAESSMKIENGVLIKYAVSDNMTSINIPSNVKEIGDEAFMNDKTLESIGIPASVTKIGKKAFYGCSELRSVKLQEGTESIGESAFAMCSSLSSFSMPSTISYVGDGAFAGDTELTNVSLGNGNSNSYFFFNDNVLYNMNSTKLVSYIPGRDSDNFIMPFTVSLIAPYAFWGSEKMKMAYVANNVETISSFAFCNAAGLEEIYIPNSVNTIEDYAFRDCYRLKYVAIENSACDIADKAFENCPEGMKIEYGVNKSAFISNANNYAIVKTSSGNQVISGNEARKKNKEDGNLIEDDNSNESDSASDDSDSDTKAGTVKNGGSLVVDSVWGTKAPYTPVDRENPKGLVGTGKIVGDSVYIIPNDDYNKEMNTESGNSVSDMSEISASIGSVSGNTTDSVSSEKIISGRGTYPKNGSTANSYWKNTKKADETVSKNRFSENSDFKGRGTVSNNTVSDNTLSGNTISEDSVSKNTASGNGVSKNKKTN